MKDIYLSVDNQKLKGTLIFPEHLKEKNPAVLFLHGWMSSENRHIERAKALAKMGYICLTFTRRDYQETTGKYKSLTIADHMNDCLTAYDFLVSQKEVDQNHISVYGGSYGGYLATLLVTKRRVDSLVLLVPALYPDSDPNTPKVDVNLLEQKDFQKTPISPANNSALKSLSQFQGKVLIVEAEKDEKVPHEATQAYIDAVRDKTSLTYKVLKDADHRLTKEEWRREFIEILIEQFEA
jgi:uncharacterized protein